MQRTKRVVKLAMLEARKVTIRKAHIYAGDDGATQLNEEAKKELVAALDRWIEDLKAYAKNHNI